MTVSELDTALQQTETLRDEATRAIARAESVAELEEARVRHTGKKSEVSRVMQVMPKLDPDTRKALGASVNQAKDAIEQSLASRHAELAIVELERRLARENLDVTLPGTQWGQGYEHPLLASVREILGIFRQMGYDVAEGPEVEWDRYNFELLNIPKHHPARDEQDTFYISDEMLLRTQTSPVQIRVMQMREPPLRVVAPGFVYRNEAEDSTRADQFYQIEGLAVDEDISLSDLKGTLTEVCHRFFGPDRTIRFRASHFPFTEPSAELDIECVVCHGKGCRSCGQHGWLELGGSGVVHPQVLRNGGYDPEKVSGFAFGIGPDRFTMMRYGITDLRLFRENDLRFLRQFN
jgi:phenylalanyl-tRNA synthetase alpha chain